MATSHRYSSQPYRRSVCTVCGEAAHLGRSRTTICMPDSSRAILQDGRKVLVKDREVYDAVTGDRICSTTSAKWRCPPVNFR